ncbi:MAG: hypothetical protein ACF8OB_02920, partial [Phycisphaeraceae bacterium JB051]
MIALVLVCGMVAWGEEPEKKTPKLEDQPTGIQRLFEQQAPNWVKIGDKLWCIEVMNEAQKRSKRGKGDAYTHVSAPWFYEPISDTRCRWIGEVYKQMKLEVPEGYELLEGRVSFNQREDGFHILPNKQRVNVFVFDSYATPELNSSVVVIGKQQAQKYEYKAGGRLFSHSAYRQLSVSDASVNVSPR